MEITFSSEKLRKVLNDSRQISRNYGKIAKTIERRLFDMRAVPNLEGLYALPGTGCHELSKNRAGQLAVNLGQPYRLIFKPTNNPLPLKADGGLNRNLVTAIEVLEITDYH
jgi:plasmid maintenance system killer protein